MATASVVRYQRKKKIGDDKSPIVYVFKPKSEKSKPYFIELLARKTEPIGSLSVEDMERVIQPFVCSMKRVLIIGNKVRVDGSGIFCTTLAYPDVEQGKDCTVKSIIHVSLHFKVGNFLWLVNDSTATTCGGDNNVVFELISKNTPASEGSSDGGGSGSGGGSGDGPNPGSDGGGGEAPGPIV